MSDTLKIRMVKARCGREVDVPSKVRNMEFVELDDEIFLAWTEIIDTESIR